MKKDICETIVLTKIGGPPGGRTPHNGPPKMKLLNCSTQKHETHNVGKCLQDNWLD